MRTTLRRTLLGRGRHDGGASAVEYALILAGVAILSIGAIFALGRTAKTAFTNATSVVSTQPAGVLPVVPDTTSAAPTPTTTSPTPTPTRTTASPTPTPSPTTTLPRDTQTVPDGQTTRLINLSGTPTNVSVSMTPDVGSVQWSNGDLYITTDGRNGRNTTTTVTYSYTLNGVNYTGTILVTVS